jgi:hypothetical protein
LGAPEIDSLVVASFVGAQRCLQRPTPLGTFDEAENARTLSVCPILAAAIAQSDSSAFINVHARLAVTTEAGITRARE